LFGAADGSGHAFSCWCEDDFGPEGEYQPATFDRGGFGHSDLQLISASGADAGESDSGVAAGGFEYGHTGLEFAGIFCRFDHGESDAVFDAPERIHVFDFGDDFCGQSGGQFAESDERSVTDTFRDGVANAATTAYSPIYGIAPGVFTQLLGRNPPDLYRDPASVFAGENPPYTYVRGFFPKNATISPSTGLQSVKGAQFRDVLDGLSNTLAIAESAGRPFVYVRGRRLGGGNALTDTDPSSANTDRLNSGGWSRPASDIVLFGGTTASNGVLGGTVAINATNGHNLRGLNYSPTGGIAQTILGLPIGIHGTGAPYSFHTGGAQFALGDGSVRFITENISFSVFIALATPAGGEVIGEF